MLACFLACLLARSLAVRMAVDGGDSLDARAHYVAARELQAGLLGLAAASASASASSVQAQQGDGVDALLELLDDTAADLALRSEQWELHGALYLWRTSRVPAASDDASAGASAVQVGALQECLDAHLVATQRSPGLDWRAFARFASLRLALHCAYAGLPLPPSLTGQSDEDADDEQMDTADDAGPSSRRVGSGQVDDVLKRTTGLLGGPVIETSTSTYVPASLPSLPGRAQLQAEGRTELLQQYDGLIGSEATSIALREAYSRIAYDLDKVSVLDLGGKVRLLTHLHAEPSHVAAVP